MVPLSLQSTCDHLQKYGQIIKTLQFQQEKHTIDDKWVYTPSCMTHNSLYIVRHQNTTYYAPKNNLKTELHTHLQSKDSATFCSGSADVCGTQDHSSPPHRSQQSLYTPPVDPWWVPILKTALHNTLNESVLNFVPISNWHKSRLHLVATEHGILLLKNKTQVKQKHTYT